MRKIQVQPLTAEAFSSYGSFASFLEPTGISFDGFYRDQVLMPVSGRMPVAFSPLTVEKSEKMVVAKAEYHNYTVELVMPLNDDAVLHVAPASKGPVPEQTEAFLVPKGTLVCLRAGTWHLAALPVREPQLQVLIGLPERTYENDCVVVEYKAKEHMELVL